jgi:hypothetical protein
VTEILNDRNYSSLWASRGLAAPFCVSFNVGATPVASKTSERPAAGPASRRNSKGNVKIANPLPILRLGRDQRSQDEPGALRRLSRYRPA